MTDWDFEGWDLPGLGSWKEHGQILKKDGDLLQMTLGILTCFHFGPEMVAQSTQLLLTDSQLQSWEKMTAEFQWVLCDPMKYLDHTMAINS